MVGKENRVMRDSSVYVKEDIFVSLMEKIIRERKAISDLRKRQLETKERREKDQGLPD